MAKVLFLNFVLKPKNFKFKEIICPAIRKVTYTMSSVTVSDNDLVTKSQNLAPQLSDAKHKGQVSKPLL